MSYVSIWKPVHDRIVQAAKDTSTEIVGLLIGKLQDDTIIIEDSTTGEFASEPHRVTLPGSSIAKIANDILTGRLKGNVVGWYHSHTAGGLFFSETDVATQRTLQQFSSLITGMVVDARNGEVGYFRVIPQTERAFRLLNENIRVYEDEQDALPRTPETPAALAPPVPPPVPPTPAVEVRRRPPKQQLTHRLALAIVLVTLIISIALIGAVVYNSTLRTTPLTVIHNPVLEGTIGTPIVISANTTGTARNLTLIYGTNSNANVSTAMSLVTSGQYSYTIPGEAVTGNIAYYILAIGSQGNQVKTPTYQITVGDFKPIPQTNALTVYRTKSATTSINLLSINNFNKQLSLTSTGAPNGLTVTFSSNTAQAGNSLELNITATPLTPNGTYPIIITATYMPPQSTPVVHETTIQATIADFELQVTPLVTSIHRGSSTVLNVTLTLEKGFTDPVTINILDLPQGSSYTMTNGNPTIISGSPATTTITVQIKASTTVKVGTYTVQIQATGAGIVHTQVLELTVR
ncbi:MAG TPA: Mov34/MPN/PAD-1 family protein [Terriglobales bacterium]|nr:Mov34/MPN/PAD-1 family protein [Terriglobales bacterium]